MSSERSDVLAETERLGTPAELEPADDHDRSIERTRRQLRRQAAAIERAELQRAYDRLVATGELTEVQRREVKRLADRIVAGLMDSWDASGDAIDSELALVLRTLYDLD